MPLSVTQTPLALGDAGIIQTLAIMRQLVHRGTSSPLVVQTARQLATVSGRQSARETAVNIQFFLRRVWRFVEDPADAEHLEDAPYLLAEYQRLGYVPGDCDEAAILGATLGVAVGLSATFTVLAFGPVPASGAWNPAVSAPYSHVYATLLTPDGHAINLDVTKPAGVPVAPVVRSLEINV